MYNLLPRLTPVLVLGIMLGGFMAVDKLWLHWYTPDTSKFSLEHQAVQAGPAAAAQPLAPAPNPGSSESETSTFGPSLRSRNAFAALWVVAQQTPYKVRYETSSSENGDKGDSYFIFNKPPLGRVDTIPRDATKPSSQLFVTAEGATIGCSSAAGQDQCVPIEPFAAPLPLAAGPIVFPLATTFGSYDVTELDSRVVAGTSARCFHLASTEAGFDEADYCFSFTDAPVPVYGRGTFGVVEASEISSAVSDADFVASAPPARAGAPQGLAFTSVVGDSPGGTASVSVQTAPGASCSIEYTTPAGAVSLDPGLVARLADGSGAVSWSWRIGSRSRLGTGTVAVTCDGEQASADISID